MKLTRQNPRGTPPIKRRERNENRVEHGKTSSEDKKKREKNDCRAEPERRIPGCPDITEPGLQLRGKAIQDMWGATQRTVKLIGSSTENHEHGEKVHAKVSSRAETVPSGKNPIKSSEKGNQFQVVLTELKSRTRARTLKKQGNLDAPPKLEFSPTSIISDNQNGNNNQRKNDAPTLEEGTLISSSSDHGSPTNIMNWLNKTGIFQKGAPGSDRFQLGSLQIQRRREHIRSPKRGKENHPPPGIKEPNRFLQKVNPQLFRPRKSDINPTDETTLSNRRHLWFDKDSGSPQQKRAPRFTRPFKKKATEMGFDERSRSLGYFELQAGMYVEEGIDYELMDKSSGSELAMQIKHLLTTMTSCEQELANIRKEAEQSTENLRSQVRRLNQVVVTITHTQELRYNNLIGDIRENHRNLGQIESGFDYLLATLNRPRGSSFQNKLYRLMWFLLDHIIISLLSLVQISTAFYARYRYKKKN